MPALPSSFLLLLKLADQVVLVGDLLPQSHDLIVLGALVFLALRTLVLQVCDLVPQAVGIRSDFDGRLLDPGDQVLLPLDPLVAVVQLLCHIIASGFEPLSLVDDVLN